MLYAKVHNCDGQERIVQGTHFPPAPKCHCRQFIKISEATRIVKEGSASWVWLSLSPETVKELCHICKGTEDVASCDNCDASGYVEFVIQVPEYGTDIVYVSSKPADPTERKVRLNTRLKTPRVATIEKSHIERAYVYGNKDAEDRIDEYGDMIQKNLQEQGAQLSIQTGKGKEILFNGRPEPENNRSKGEGRDWDRGRAI